jgi:hypothetical protein
VAFLPLLSLRGPRHFGVMKKGLRRPEAVAVSRESASSHDGVWCSVIHAGLSVRSRQKKIISNGIRHQPVIVPVGPGSGKELIRKKVARRFMSSGRGVGATEVGVTEWFTFGRLRAAEPNRVSAPDNGTPARLDRGGAQSVGASSSPGYVMTSCACRLKTAAACPGSMTPPSNDYRSCIRRVTKCDCGDRAARQVQKIRVFISLNRARSAIGKRSHGPMRAFFAGSYNERRFLASVLPVNSCFLYVTNCDVRAAS